MKFRSVGANLLQTVGETDKTLIASASTVTYFNKLEGVSPDNLLSFVFF